MRLLALIPGGIGDQLLCFPMLDSLQQQYPQAQIDVVVEIRAKAAYRVSQVVKQILTYDFQGRNGPADWGNLIGWIREREYDGLISLDPGWFGGLLLWLMGVPKRVGFAGRPGSVFLTDTVPLKSKQYATQMYHDLLSGMEIHVPCPALSIRIPLTDLDWADSERSRLGLSPDQGYVLVHGGSVTEHGLKGAGSVYPATNWQSLVKGLQDRQPNVPVLLVQSLRDREWYRPIQEGCPGIKVSTPDDLGKFAALVAGATHMVCPDCDAMQLAVALEKPLFALFGPTNAALVLPQTASITVMRSQTGKVADIAPIQILEKMI
ncbi:MAG: glycosyltransferase family 9 protein [Thermosynechococcaceae cyanobacterium]